MSLRAVFEADTPLLGMVHLPALPGAPGFDGDRQSLRRRALADALALSEGGFDGLVVENFGDRPYYPESVPAHVVAELTATVRELTTAFDEPVGVNVLRTLRGDGRPTGRRTDARDDRPGPRRRDTRLGTSDRDASRRCHRPGRARRTRRRGPERPSVCRKRRHRGHRRQYVRRSGRGHRRHRDQGRRADAKPRRRGPGS